MKKIAAVLAALAMVFMTGCDTDPAPYDPVTGGTLSLTVGGSTGIQRGGLGTFQAALLVGTPPANLFPLTWGIVEDDRNLYTDIEPGTGIGVGVRIGRGETRPYITVRAHSTEHPDIYGTFRVNMLQPVIRSTAVYMEDDIILNWAALRRIDMPGGTYEAFTAEVDGDHVAYLPVFWQIVGDAPVGTSIDRETGVLTVAGDTAAQGSATAANFRIQAYIGYVTGVDPDLWGTAAVYVRQPTLHGLSLTLPPATVYVYIGENTQFLARLTGTGRIPAPGGFYWEQPERVSFSFFVEDEYLWNSWPPMPPGWDTPIEDCPNILPGDVWSYAQCHRAGWNPPYVHVQTPYGMNIFEVWDPSRPVIHPQTVMEQTGLLRVHQNEADGEVRLVVSVPDLPELDSTELVVQITHESEGIAPWRGIVPSATAAHAE